MIPKALLKLICITSLSSLAYRLEEITTENVPVNDKLEPDVFRNVSELITSKGYQVEEYEVTTSDGYILGVQRIPYAHGEKRHDSKGVKKVVFLQHGLAGESTNFVLNFPNNSLAFVLADAGYDVWMGNSRGNTYSRRHIKYDPKSKEFWKFTWDEMAKYDLPATIDFILNSTGQTQLYYVGHSQGTTIMFALLSESPEYNKKIKLGVALAPVSTVGYIESPIRYLAPFSHDIETLLLLLGVTEFEPSKSLMSYIENIFCDFVSRKLCENVMFLVCGIDMDQLNQTRIPVYIAHAPGGTSTIDVIHYAQMVESMTFQKMDYGKEENLERYGQITPPLYYVENITAPVALLWGLNDWMASATDVALLEPKLKNLVKSYRVPFPKWNHVDFVMGIDAYKYVHQEVLLLLSKY